MPRPLELLRTVSSDRILPPLRAALDGSGPAVLPGGTGAVPDTVPKRVAVVVQTSGSTGDAKRVMLSADALLASAAASEAVTGPPGQWLLALPAQYIAGINVLVRSIVAGTDPVETATRPFTPERFVADARTMTHALRYTALVPAQLARLLDHPEAAEALAGFRAVLVGGQATPAALLERAAGAGVRVIRTYGSSETSGGCVYDGRPTGAMTARVVEGELWLGGPTLAEGYLGEEQLTAERFVTDAGERWYRTSDAGEVVEGVVRVHGRLDDVIVSGGVNVSLGAVERVVRELPGLDGAVVVRVPDATWGEVPVVVGTASVDLGAVRAAVADALGRAAAPARIVVVDALPMLPSGKPDRVAITARVR